LFSEIFRALTTNIHNIDNYCRNKSFYRLKFKQLGHSKCEEFEEQKLRNTNK